MEGWMDGYLEINPCVQKDIGPYVDPLGPLPKKGDRPNDGQTDRKTAHCTDCSLVASPSSICLGSMIIHRNLSGKMSLQKLTYHLRAYFESRYKREHILS